MRQLDLEILWRHFQPFKVFGRVFAEKHPLLDHEIHDRCHDSPFRQFCLAFPN